MPPLSLRYLPLDQIEKLKPKTQSSWLVHQDMPLAPPDCSRPKELSTEHGRKQQNNFKLFETYQNIHNQIWQGASHSRVEAGAGKSVSTRSKKHAKSRNQAGPGWHSVWGRSKLELQVLGAHEKILTIVELENERILHLSQTGTFARQYLPWFHEGLWPERTSILENTTRNYGERVSQLCHWLQ